MAQLHNSEPTSCLKSTARRKKRKRDRSISYLFNYGRVKSNKMKTEETSIENDEEDENVAVRFVCLHCESDFTSLEELHDHMQIHNNFLCSPNNSISNKTRCETNSTKLLKDVNHKGDSNVNKRGLRDEEVMHSCPTCSRLFNKKYNLNTHMRTHSGEQPYRCRVCLKTFSYKANMQTHERTHKGEKPYICRHCDKTFTQAGSLKIHIRTHTGEKPFTCSQCKKQFIKISDLRRHERIHTQIKSCECSVCGRAFADCKSLEMHKRKHNDDRPFVCYMCDKSFTRVGTLQAHVKRHSHTEKEEMNSKSLDSFIDEDFSDSTENIEILTGALIEKA